MSSLVNSLDMSLDDLIKKKSSNPRNNNAKSGGNSGGRDGGGRFSSRRGGRNDGRGRGGGSGPVRRNNMHRRDGRSSAPYARRNRNNDNMAMDVDEEDDDNEDNDNVIMKMMNGGKNNQAQRRSSDSRGRKSSILSRLGKKEVSASQMGTKILVKNLKYDVLEADVKELFGTVGQVSKAEIVYDRSGRSTGVARVWFERRSDAEKAIKQYDGRTLDGQPMAISLDERGGSAVQRSTGQRSGGEDTRTGRSGGANVRKGLFGTALNRDNVNFKVTFNRNRFGGRGNRGRSGGRGRGRSGGRSKTTEELDEEMDSYMQDA